MTQIHSGAQTPTGDDEGAEPSSPFAFLRRLFGARPQDAAPEPGAQTEAEAQSAAGAQEILLNLQNMRGMRVDDVMIPRADISAVGVEDGFEDVLAMFRETGHTRLPLYRETLDDPLGFIHLKDIALRHGFSPAREEVDLMALMRPMMYVPASMPIGALLQRMQAERVHMALVIDEYGGVDGLITIEDLLEQIVGEIADEHDAEDAQAFREEAPGTYVCEARTFLQDFEPVAGVDLLPDDLDEDVDTLGGLVFVLANRIPARGEVIAHPDGHDFEIVDADSRRMKRLRVRVANPEAQAAE